MSASIILPGPMPIFPKKSKETKTKSQERRRWRNRRNAPLKRWKRVNKESRTRKIENQIYRIEAPKFLKEHPVCEVRVRPDGTVAHRNDTSVPFCGRKSTQVHHIRFRGKYFLDKKYWLATSTCHHPQWMHQDNGKEAERLGYIEREYEKH